VAEIRPFRGIRFNQSKVGDLGKVVAPPYDIITSEEQKQLYDRNPLNIIRLEYGYEFPQDTEADNRYTRAAAQFREWLDNRTLKIEDKPALYLHDHSFTHEGKRFTRRGLACAVRLEEWSKGVVLPHEDTMAGPKVDRLKLFHATGVSCSPVFGLYRDTSGEIGHALEEVASQPPAQKFKDEGGDEHTFWTIDDESLIAQITSYFGEHKIFIADGHHRYETALKYRDERRAAQGTFSENEAFNFVFMILAEITAPGLLILPIHRLVKKGSLPITKVLQKIKGDFDVEDMGSSQVNLPSAILAERRQRSPDGHFFGLIFGSGAGAAMPHWYLLSLRNFEDAARRIDGRHSLAWKTLDVSILHSLVIDPLLRESGIAKTEEAIEFDHHEANVLEMIKSGEYPAAFLVNPTTVNQVIEVALASDRMPQKSTFFYPKLPTGLVLYPENGVLE